MKKEKRTPQSFDAKGQRPDTKTRADIKIQTTDNKNPNSGPQQRSKKKDL